MATLVEASCTSETIEVARLLVSELVTNVVQHSSADSVTVEVVVVHPRFRVAVHDDDPTMPQPRVAAAADPNGRGLLLIDALAERRGAEECHEPAGKVAWFEMTCA